MNTKRVKALSIWQPWASLIVAGEKEYETRGWKTNYRGPLVIHASKRWGSDQRQICERWPYRQLVGALMATGSEGEWLPALGKCLGVVDLIGVFPTNSKNLVLSDQEKALGDFRPGRYAWRLANPRLFKEPVYAQGAQGLWYWNVPEGLHKLVFGR